MLSRRVPPLQLLADYKYDHYQRFGPGRRFIESLGALARPVCPRGSRYGAQFSTRSALSISPKRSSCTSFKRHIPDLIVQERLRLVAGEQDIPAFHVGKLRHHARFRELQLKTLYLGLSDGARTNELRRASGGEIGNEQIWQAYELGDDKATEMAEALRAGSG